MKKLLLASILAITSIGASVQASDLGTAAVVVAVVKHGPGALGDAADVADAAVDEGAAVVALPAAVMAFPLAWIHRIISDVSN